MASINITDVHDRLNFISQLYSISTLTPPATELYTYYITYVMTNKVNIIVDLYGIEMLSTPDHLRQYQRQLLQQRINSLSGLESCTLLINDTKKI